MKVKITYDDTLYQLVPKEPTSEMVKAGGSAWVDNWRVYRAMLAAAPTPPAQPAEIKPQLVAGDGMPCPNTHDPQCGWPDCMCRKNSAHGIKGES